MRFLILLLMIFVASSAFAQGVDWDKIGRPLGEDSVDVYDRYVYFDETKTSAPNVPVTNPLISLQEVERWLMEQAPYTLNFDWQAANQHFIDVKPLFTEKGLRAYFDFLAEINAINTVTKNAASLTTVVSFTPDILGHGVIQDVYRWNANVPLIMTYQSPQGVQSEELTINVDLIRVPLDQSEDGIAIDHWEIKRDKPEIVEQSSELPPENENIPVDESVGPAYQ